MCWYFVLYYVLGLVVFCNHRALDRYHLQKHFTSLRVQVVKYWLFFLILTYPYKAAALNLCCQFL